MVSLFLDGGRVNGWYAKGQKMMPEAVL